MRKTLLMSAALLGMSVVAGYAQNTTTSGQTPPAPRAGSQTVQPSNSLPAGGGNSAGYRAGSDVGTTGSAMPQGSVGQGSMMQGAAPMGAEPMDEGTGRHRMMHERRMRHGAHDRARMRRNADEMDNTAEGGRAPADQFNGVPPTSAYQGGAGSPRSNAASNITAGDTRSQIAPRLPDPGANGNSPEAYLAAAQRALSRNQTGAAQEALERAETRVLTRSTEPSMANTPDDRGIAQAITDARRALANRDSARAQSIIGQYLGRGS